MAPASGGPVDPALIEDLVAASRILAAEGVLDGYGHVSMRHPGQPERYLMSRSLAPALVTADDIMELDLESNPVDARGRTMFRERFIHGSTGFQARRRDAILCAPDLQSHRAQRAHRRSHPFRR